MKNRAKFIMEINFQALGVNVVHIESRPSRRKDTEYEILVDVECDNKKMEELVVMLRKEVSAINLKQYEEGYEFPPPTPTTASFGKRFTRQKNRNFNFFFFWKT